MTHTIRIEGISVEFAFAFPSEGEIDCCGCVFRESCVTSLFSVLERNANEYGGETKRNEYKPRFVADSRSLARGIAKVRFANVRARG